LFQLILSPCARDSVEALSDFLEVEGALSVTFSDQFDVPVLEPLAGETPLWETVVMEALFADDVSVEALCMKVLQHYPMLHCRLLPVAEKNWVEVVRAHFKPRAFGQRLWVCPSWLAPPEPDAVNLILDPGLAFGTGMHPTTALCLRWLDAADMTDKTLIDYGCGTGILALAALKLGASHVSAVDIDEQALVATRSNAEVNGLLVDTALQVGMPEYLHIPVDVILANILMQPLLSLCERFHSLLNPHGTLVISGLLSAQEDTVRMAYEGVGFTHAQSITDDGWLLMCFTV